VLAGSLFNREGGGKGIAAPREEKGKASLTRISYLSFFLVLEGRRDGEESSPSSTKEKGRKGERNDFFPRQAFFPHHYFGER